MEHRVLKARARPDYRVEIEWVGGERALIDLSDFVATGEVTAPLRADPAYFVEKLAVLENGLGIGWPGEVDIDADALWYDAHPEDWKRDYGNSSAAE
jgi:Protein of unknown function (DUF2442)